MYIYVVICTYCIAGFAFKITIGGQIRRYICGILEISINTFSVAM